eukprot:TRINITY_DN3713_c0_g1_i2.p1 TRINITY_DN3713_c0_g1~~TRINITY_DN3713_c0_g1_i2.p1  ORF type:complete len:300 (+),score=57.62 TRINITY_DN3713_c0_g1_i2:190-1089(+)
MADRNRRKDVVTGCATYEGETKQGMKHGRGTLIWDDGDEYIGDFENDEKVKGTFNWKGGDTYTGEWKNSLMHGYGTYTYRNGRKYEGQWEGGFKEGKGVFCWPNGDKYEGQFHRDNCHGFGVQTYADKRVYKGEWFQNKKHGYGTMIQPNNEKTQGLWQNNLPCGTAIFAESNGKRFEVKWKTGDRDPNRVPLKRSEEEVAMLLSATDPPVWANDAEFKTCFKCSQSFSMVNRRHHCRHCGFIFCQNCTTKRLEIPRIRFAEPVRVCDECFVSIKTASPSPDVWTSSAAAVAPTTDTPQ